MQGYNRNIGGVPGVAKSGTSTNTPPSHSSHVSGSHSAASNFSNMEVENLSYNQMDVSVGESPANNPNHTENDKRRHMRLRIMKSKNKKKGSSATMDMNIDMDTS